MARSLPRVRIYATPNGRTPFTEWLEALKDQRGRDIIKVRVRRISVGNFGDNKSLGGGLYELRVNFGPGYRVHFGRENEDVILLWGGQKQQQAKDIARARIYWTEYETRSGA
ncbi:MAG: type II toxin-antitoxin system RelE/ParE family toxin [Acidobacteriia bacterium]|nr:type II toxin-antitoxin system RelE/ParE family toxin [Terriglobia bacterium]